MSRNTFIGMLLLVVLSAVAARAQADDGIESGDPGTGTVSAEAARIPEAARALYAKALEASAAGDRKRAVRELKAALEVHPQFPLALNEPGAQYMMLGQPDEADKAFASGVRLAPDAPALRINSFRLY